MKHNTGYSFIVPKHDGDAYAKARVEYVDASHKDLAELCGRIRGRSVSWVLKFLENAAAGEIPVFYARHNKKLGHRHELRGRKGRYPRKAAAIVLKAVRSAESNGRQKGIEEMKVVHAAANRKNVFPRLSPKGRRMRQNYSTSRVEIVLKSTRKPEAENQKPGVGNKKLEAQDAKPVTENRQLKTENMKQEAENRKHETGNRKPETKNQEQETRNREPATGTGNRKPEIGNRTEPADEVKK